MQTEHISLSLCEVMDMDSGQMNMDIHCTFSNTTPLGLNTYVIFCLKRRRHWVKGPQSAAPASRPWSTSCKQTKTNQSFFFLLMIFISKQTKTNQRVGTPSVCASLQTDWTDTCRPYRHLPTVLDSQSISS